jgi:hypothetical protein
MAKSIQAYLDNKGNLHMSPKSAVIGDIAYVLGRVGEEGGLTEGVARLILEKRDQIEQAFDDFDNLDCREPIVLDALDGNVEVLDLERRRPDAS